MQKHMTIINLACTITKLRKWGEAWKHSAESAQANTARLHQANKELEREKFMTAGLIDKLIADRDEAWKERDTQTADHERKMAEHRAAFGARTVADTKIIAGLREESAKYKAERDDLYQREGIEQKRRMDVEDERNALRAEVAELKTQLERLKSHSRAPKYKVGDKLESYNRSLGLAIPVTVVGVRTVYDCQPDGAEYPVGLELNERYAQTPKQHPVKVGEWVRRLVPSPACGVGTVAKVVHVNDNTSKIEYDVKRIDGQHGFWFARNCEPCDPPEATHDTKGGKAAAEAALKSESVTDIKVGDLCEVFQATTRTLKTDIGITGRVSSVHLDPCHGGFLVKFDPSTQSRRSTGMQAFGLCDVRKVTT